MATHSSVLAWRIAGTEEPGGLHRVGHDWSDLAAAAAAQHWKQIWAEGKLWSSAIPRSSGCSSDFSWIGIRFVPHSCPLGTPFSHWLSLGQSGLSQRGGVLGKAVDKLSSCVGWEPHSKMRGWTIGAIHLARTVKVKVKRIASPLGEFSPCLAPELEDVFERVQEISHLFHLLESYSRIWNNIYLRISWVAQMVKNLPEVRETWVQSLGCPWRRKWQPSPVFWPGEFHGQRSLVGYSPWGRRELDTTERLTLSLFHYDVWERHWEAFTD